MLQRAPYTTQTQNIQNVFICLYERSDRLWTKPVNPIPSLISFWNLPSPTFYTQFLRMHDLLVRLPKLAQKASPNYSVLYYLTFLTHLHLRRGSVTALSLFSLCSAELKLHYVLLPWSLWKCSRRVRRSVTRNVDLFQGSVFLKVPFLEKQKWSKLVTTSAQLFQFITVKQRIVKWAIFFDRSLSVVVAHCLKSRRQRICSLVCRPLTKMLCRLSKMQIFLA